ncbi:hypothetical protein [Actinomadura rudentiformis]|uniref:hypothetical protein n=1 Tax=Actinomadura rudentiformis TaxID=359158 RepID=UPI0021F3E1DD|nr:hypothetical protein [Actinomadura rudentiformis]
MTSWTTGWAFFALRAFRRDLMAARSGAAIGAGASGRRQTRATMTTSRGSRMGVSRHQVRGSATYRPCEISSSVRRLPSMTGRVDSQVRTPGGTM